MNFYITLTKTRRKVNKYLKVNRIRNKVIVDINELLKDLMDINDVSDNDGLRQLLKNKKHKDYFNLMVYTKINHALKKGKDIYYIPQTRISELKIEQIFKLKETIAYDINFNILLFYNEFIDDIDVLNEIFENLDKFNSTQIIKDY